MSAPTPLHAPFGPTPSSATSSAAVSRVSSTRSNAPPSSSASTTRIRKGLLSRAGSEAEDRYSRAASASHTQLTTDDDDDEYMISDSGPMPRRFASQNRAPSGPYSSSRQSSNSSLPHTTPANRYNAASYPLNASSVSIASGNRSGSGEASEGAASGVGSVSLGRAMSVSSVSSVNSTSSLEAVPFREAPLGNVRLGFGGSALRVSGRNARTNPYSSLAITTQPPAAGQAAPLQAADHHLPATTSVSDSHSTNNDAACPPSLFAAPTAASSGQSTTFRSPLPASDRHKGVPKPATDAWMYRVGPGMRTNRPPRPSSTASPELPESPLDEGQSPSSPAKRSREALRQKFAKGAGRLGIKTNIVTSYAPSASEQYTVYNPVDSSEDEIGLVPPSRTPLPRSSSYFSAAPHSANTAAGTPLQSYPLLTPVPADFRTSSITNAPLFVPKFAEDLPSVRPTPESSATPSSAANGMVHDPRLATSADASLAPFLPPLSYGAQVGSISSDLSPYLAGGAALPATSNSQHRHRLSATQKPVLMRNQSSNDALDRLASPGLFIRDPSAATAPSAEPALYTSSTSAASTQRSPQVELALKPVTSVQASPHPTPAQVVQMEAQAGIASLPDSPSEPSPVPASYSPAIADAAIANAPVKAKLRRPSSGTGSEASLSLGPATTGSSRRPESLQRQRMWSNPKRPAILRTQTSESTISKARRSHSADRRAYSPSRQSPTEAVLHDTQFDRPGTHSKNSSSSTATGGDLGARVSAHVAVIPEDDDGVSGSVGAPFHPVVIVQDDSSRNSLRLASGIEADHGRALSPTITMRPMPGPRSASPASQYATSQYARSPETIRIGPSRITDSLYGRSPASISNLQSPLLQPSPTPAAPERATTPSLRASSARGPHDFHFGETLGEGSYSTVLEAWDLVCGPSAKEPGVIDPNATSAAAAMVGSESSRKRRRRIDLTGRKAYAIKVLDKVHILKQGKQKYVSIEKEALSRMIRHPGVVTLFWTFQDRESLYFVLELANNGELLNFIRKHGSFDRESARFYAAQLADTIDAMHTAGVVHRDVKPENILLDAKYRIKITDFGSAKIVHPVGEAEATPAASAEKETTSAAQPSRAASFVGTAEYVSPELLVEKAQPAGKPADWWAFGCVLFQMLAGRPPFKGVNEYQTLQKVKNREFSFPHGFPEDAQDLINKVLVLDPARRPSAREIKAHRFFEAIAWDELWEMDVPQIKTGLVQPTPTHQQQRGEETSDFSFDEGFGSSDESQAYNGDTQSIDREGEESELSVDRLPDARREHDADDSDLSDDSSNRAEPHLPKRQSGLQRLADGFQSRFMSSVGASASPQANGGAPRRRFSNMSIEAPAPAPVASGATLESIGVEGSSSGATRPMRPFSRSTQTMSTHTHTHTHTHSPSPNSTTRAQQACVSSAAATSAGGGGGGLQQSWAALLLPKEMMLYSLPVAQKKTGTGKMFTKRRQLVLTDFPRLLCVKETATALKVKSEVILAIPRSNATMGGDATGDLVENSSGRQAFKVASDGEQVGEAQGTSQVRSTREQVIPNLLTALEYRGGRSFTVRTANARVFLYETLAGDAGALVKCIQDARRTAN